jgi:hypothetical protein
MTPRANGTDISTDGDNYLDAVAVVLMRHKRQNLGAALARQPQDYGSNCGPTSIPSRKLCSCVVHDDQALTAVLRGLAGEYDATR